MPIASVLLQMLRSFQLGASHLLRVPLLYWRLCISSWRDTRYDPFLICRAQRWNGVEMYLTAWTSREHPRLTYRAGKLIAIWREVYSRWGRTAIWRMLPPVRYIELSFIMTGFFYERFWKRFREGTFLHTNRRRIQLATLLVDIVAEKDLLWNLISRGKFQRNHCSNTLGCMRAAFASLHKMTMWCAWVGLCFWTSMTLTFAITSLNAFSYMIRASGARSWNERFGYACQIRSDAFVW